MTGSHDDEHFRELRASLLSWYPFRGGAHALLICRDGEYLSPVLRRYYEKLDQIPAAVFAEEGPGPFADYEAGSIDCIVVIDPEEAGDNLKELAERAHLLLRGSGQLLFGFRNRFGLHYFCGGIDDLVPYPFAGIRGDGIHLFAKQEIDALMESAGFPHRRFYYLMPDGNYPQAVYTDSHLPADTLLDRLYPRDPYNSPAVIVEQDLYSDMLREGSLPQMANYYLLEAGKQKPDLQASPAVDCAFVSADRGMDSGVITTLCSDGIARKRPADPEKAALLKTQYNNLCALSERGIPTVPQKLFEDRIEMPVIREESALTYLKRILDTDPEAFIAVFEQIRRDALLSSGPAEIPDEQAEELWGCSGKALGPVLQTGYIDMIPYNAFRSGGRLLYYDQEFTMPDCPVGYILYRALYYTWVNIPEAENIIPLEEMKRRFGLQEIWAGCSRREEQFLSGIRCREKYHMLYDWAIIERETIRNRCRRLMNVRVRDGEEALLSGIHRVQLELLHAFDRACREHGLRYYAVHGTLLGAVRHRGFIPWDYDVDLAMPREDYDRLLELGDSIFREPYFLQTVRSDPICFYGGYSKLRDSRTTAREPVNRYRNVNQGIWIDIFPLDHCPEEPEKRKKLQNKIRFWQRLIYAKLYPFHDTPMRELNGASVSFYYLLQKCLRLRWLYRRLEKLCTSCRPSGFRSILNCYYGSMENKNIFKEEEMQGTEYLPFGDMAVPAPSGYESWLRRRYGEHYLRWPLPENRYRHLDTEFDPEHSFRDYNT